MDRMCCNLFMGTLDGYPLKHLTLIKSTRTSSTIC
uniref:Uncharacterized protein n=1 Tax=Rhizophora mucronata TaxID=61149 RepID=A0A2P2QUZ1_RHIMU